jgi:hypothetical protein
MSIAENGLWYDTPPFKSLNELNQWLQQRCQAQWQESAHPQLKARSLAQCLEDERSQLRWSVTSAKQTVLEKVSFGSYRPKGDTREVISTVC